LVSFAIIFSQDRLIPSFVEILNYYSISESEVKLTYVLYFSGSFIGSLSSFYLLQKWTTQKNILLGLLLAALASLVVMISPHPWVFLVSRATEGFGIQLTANSMAPVISTMFDGNHPVTFFRRFSFRLTSAQVFSLCSASMSISGIIIPVISGLLTSTLGWHYLYLAFGILLIVLFSFTFKSPWDSIESHLIKEKDLSFAEKLRHIAHQKMFLGYCTISALCTMAIIYQIIAYSILFLEQLHINPAHFGFLSLLLGVTAIASVSIALKFAKLYEEPLRKWSLWAAPLCALILLIVNYKTLTLVGFIMPLMASNVCFGLFSPLLTAKTFNSYKDNPKLASSIYNSIQMIACILGSSVASLVNTQKPIYVLGTSVIFTLTIAISYWVLSKKDYQLIN
ncbi:MAG: MFS transporter, partial [Chlamydiae bacterium]|nr:MFS transporter [Chlamydiota bacterium]